jgi:hypothetical protein
MTALQGLRGLVVIDEAQRQPGLFPVLRVLAERLVPARGRASSGKAMGSYLYY